MGDLLTLLGFVLLPVITAQAPPSGPPQDVRASAVSSTAVRVTWNDVLADQRNGPLLHYEVLYEQFTFAEVPQSSITVVLAEDEDEVTLYQLQEYVEYNISVRADNSNGTGPFSTSVTVTTYQDVPSSAPQDVILSAEAVNEITITWNRPPGISINGVLTFYSLRYHRLSYNDFTFRAVNSDLENTVLMELESYTVYEVFIAATTVNGTGPFISRTAQTVEDVPQSSPRNLTASSATPFSTDLEWTPPDESEWNGILRGYQLRYTETDSTALSPPSWLEINISNDTTYHLNMLHPSSIYCIQVAAVTVGPGPYTPPLYVLTLEDEDGSTVSASASGSNTTVGSGESNSTVDTGSGGAELMENSTNATRSDRSISAAAIAGSVVGAVAVVLLASVAALSVGLAVWRRRHVRKSKSLSHYFVSTTSHEVFSDSSRNQNQTPSSGTANPQYENMGTGLMFTNPVANTFDLQQNRSYNFENVPSIPSPAHTSEHSHTPSDDAGVDHAPSSSARIVDNPQYWQFSSPQEQQSLSNGEGGVASSSGGVVLAFESDYDYPTTFRRPLVVNSDPYSHVRTTSDQDEPAYETIT